MRGLNHVAYTLASAAEMSCHKAMHECTTLPVARPKESSSSAKAALAKVSG